MTIDSTFGSTSTSDDSMNRLATDIATIAAQERALVFDHFDHDIAWRLGVALREAAAQRNAALTIEIKMGRQTLFHAATPGTAAVNADWVRRKGQTATHFNRSSYAVGLILQRDGLSLEDKYGVSASECSTQGGGFPLRVAGVHADVQRHVNETDDPDRATPAAVIGSIAVSGLPQRDDHRFIVDVLAAFLKKTPPALAD
jgi:uncharacterized protein (UPF0303 family)